MTRRAVSIFVVVAAVRALVLPAVAAEGVSGKWKMTGPTTSRWSRPERSWS
jgi:hypothetical protein